MMYMYTSNMKEQCVTLLSKYEDTLSDFKRKRRIAYINDEDYNEYNTYIERLDTVISALKRHENAKRVNTLIDAYADTSDIHDALIHSIRQELENVDKCAWYAEHFANWKSIPDRQECDDYPIMERLQYSQCRRVMFDHLEHDWKKKTFPNLYNRLEFF